MQKVRDLQAILISPRWAEHCFDTNATTTASQDSAEAAGEDFGFVSEQRKRLKEPGSGGSYKSEKTIRIEELKKLVIPPEVMKEGMLFIWAEKELIFDVIRHFEAQGFDYVENMTYIMLNPAQKNGK